MQPWWLDATAGPSGWDVAIVEQDGRIVAALPYVERRLLHWRLLGQPPLTQHLGPWLAPQTGKRTTRYTNEHKLLTSLLESLPKASRYLQNWSPERMNHLPFHWVGHEATVSYTYVIDYRDDDFETGIDSRIRNDLKKAKNRFGVEPVEKADIDEFIRLHRLTFDRQKIAMPYSLDLIRRIDAACAARNARTMFFAGDGNGTAAAATYVIWDERSAFYLMAGSDPDRRHLGAGTVALWEAVKKMKDRTERFNFEGSMIKPIEGHFRRYGGRRVPYLSVKGTSSFTLQCAESLRTSARRLRRSTSDSP